MKLCKYTFMIFIFFTSNLFSKDIEILFDKPGNGVEIKNHFKVHVNYRGILEDGTEFDNSFTRKEPFVFQIGIKQVILGWEKGLMGMRVGGVRTIKIPPELGYGSRGAGDLIPPNATLIFEIEIVNAFEPNYSKLSSDQIINKEIKGLIIIDIRSEKERKKTGIIEDSIAIAAFDLNGQFNSNFVKIYQGAVVKNDHVVFVSNEGKISAELANSFTEQFGLINIYSLDGGIQNWINQKKLLIK
jgi:rhodanese-related sulfurtransferase